MTYSLLSQGNGMHKSRMQVQYLCLLCHTVVHIVSTKIGHHAQVIHMGRRLSSQCTASPGFIAPCPSLDTSHYA